MTANDVTNIDCLVLSEANAGAAPPPARKTPGQDGMETNPHRSLGDALKGWRERLSVVGDAVTRPEATAGELDPEVRPGRYGDCVPDPLYIRNQTNVGDEQTPCT
jgi:hypothetical protein